MFGAGGTRACGACASRPSLGFTASPGHGEPEAPAAREQLVAALSGLLEPALLAAGDESRAAFCPHGTMGPLCPVVSSALRRILCPEEGVRDYRGEGH